MKAITRNELVDQRDKQLRVHAGTCTKCPDGRKDQPLIGTRLKVRGFPGVSLFGRSQTWQRER